MGMTPGWALPPTNRPVQILVGIAIMPIGFLISAFTLIVGLFGPVIWIYLSACVFPLSLVVGITLIIRGSRRRAAPSFNPPPGWPAPPPGWTPPPGWVPGESWPPAPPGWRWWSDHQ